MHIINIHHLTVNFAGREIFNDLTWVIGNRDRIGLVGPNGSGKSSLLKAITGIVTPDSGTVIKMRGISVGYLHQDVELPQGMTLIDTTMVPPPKLAEIEAEISRLEEQLGDPDVYSNEDRLTEVMEQLELATLIYDRLDGGRHKSKVEEVLFKLGFTANDFDLMTGSLSGGQKKLVALAQLVLEQPDVLLLDEPDNHLDLKAKGHLEAFIKGYSGGVVIVSHDRYLLDKTTTQIAEMENGKLTIYKGNYTAYVNEREAQRLRQEQQFVTQQKEIARIEAAIARFELWASMVVDPRHIKQARSRRRMLDKMDERGEIIEKVHEQKTMKLQIDGWRGSTKALEINQLSMAFDDDPLFFDLELLIRHGERVGLIGPNGAGKSVLFRLILEELNPVDGLIKIGPSTRIGYYAQEHQTLNGWLNRTPIEMLRDVRPMSENVAVTQLLKFAFTYEQTRQQIGSLSGGERSRIQLMRLMLQEPNLLLLDEPTNNLDIKSTEVLEEALEDFNGAILAISHDRYFLERVVDRIVELDDGALTSFVGGYTDYLEATGQDG
jgi:ATP-binding cassette, subfamily F, member 3